MQNQLEKFKAITIENFSNPAFEYHEWIVDYHLKIVEKIAIELCDLYPDADRESVETLVWFHDFGKPLDRKNEKAVTLVEGPKVMKECGFTDEFIAKTIEYWKMMEQKDTADISTMPIEVQIISTADGASHFTGVFHASYWSDGLSFPETQAALRTKIKKDWERKITIPEAKKAFEPYYKRALELVGEFPEKFI